MNDLPAVLAHGLADANDLGISVQPVLIAVGAIVVAAMWLAPRVRDRDAVPAYAEAAPAWLRRLVLSAGVFVLVVGIVTAALGTPDPATNASSRLLFVVGFSLLLIASAVWGPVWRAGNPLRRISRGLSRLLGDPDGELARPLTEGIGVWPAVMAAFAFVAVSLVLDHLALTVLVATGTYVVAHVLAASVVGEGWYARGDALEVASGVVGALAPVGSSETGAARRSSIAGLAAAPTPPGFLAFISVLVGGALLHAAGPSPAVGGRFVQLLVCIAIAFAGAVTATMSTPLAPALTGVAVGHLASQYYAALLLDGPFTVILLSDPFAKGWNLLGLTGAEPPENLLPPVLAVVLQLVLFVGGHVLAVLAADVIARRTVPAARRAAMQFPFRAVVLLSALAGVWLRLS